MEIRRHAMDMLARREHTRSELIQKLLQKGFDSEQVEIEVDRLGAENLQSDARFVEDYTRSKHSRGYGPRYIMNELRRKGVADSLALQNVYDDAIDWDMALRQVWEKKFMIPAGSPRDQLRQSRFLLQRGFEPDSVRLLMKKLQNGTAE